ncbi:ComEA family DNA-binding protein [Actinoplanes sp. NPDC049681]|uniref:ComEA family DNA-binding protein n=1 Tax=Actinoplanes sp. NPDC049681 TaxID=3363905 RepID=UPI00379D9AC1
MEAFYSEPVDPWADSDEIAPPPPQYVPPDVTVSTPPPSWGPAPLLPGPPPQRFPIGEVVFASLLPIIICSFGSWIYFVYAGFHRRDKRQFLVAAGYASLFGMACVFMAIDPTPVESENLSSAEWTGFFLFMATAVASAVHGGILAAHPGDTPYGRHLREQARQFAAFDPAQARRLGVGRPDLVRPFDDGGLVDLNHAPGHELARLPGITPEAAHRIVLGRFERAYAHPDELVVRGLVTAQTMNRIGSRLLCIPPVHQPR